MTTIGGLTDERTRAWAGQLLRRAFGVHCQRPWRNRMAATMGEWTWKGVYALVSLAGFVLIVWGYGLARQDPVVLYTPPAWLHPVAMVLLIPVFPLLLAAYLPGRIQTAARHPMLAATKLWAVAHLLANGTLADVLLFGAFLVWAVRDRISMKHRTQRAIPALPRARANDVIAVFGGACVLRRLRSLAAWRVDRRPARRARIKEKRPWQTHSCISNCIPAISPRPRHFIPACSTGSCRTCPCPEAAALTP
ncbi:MAG: NnrU family protein [Thiobacillus sp.]|nr:NnrU family protein [Thiobacillus sp.]